MKVCLLSSAMLAVVSLAFASPVSSRSAWKLWEDYCGEFMDAHGRVIDHDGNGRTTSEAQAYAMFFALVANDRPRFHQLLDWTENNLAQGDLKSHLPAWHWGNQGGSWRIIDRNSASDADLWIAYSLIEAGRLWHDAHYAAVGRALAANIASREVVDVPVLGKALLPGSSGFHTSDGFYQFNASYLPVQILQALAGVLPEGPWKEVLKTTPAILRGSSPAGFVLDWVAFRPGDGFSPYPTPAAQALASYDAIRVYLWAGMLHPASPLRAQLLQAMPGMASYLSDHAVPPAEVLPDGRVKNPAGSVGFSAAVLPFLRAVDCRPAALLQLQRLEFEKNPKTGLYGSKPRYYDQNLALFATGWSEERFRFSADGLLQVMWR